MKTASLLILTGMLFTGTLCAQNISYFLNSSGDTLMPVRQDGQVIIGAAASNSNAILNVDAPDNDKGIRIPRLSTTERTALSGLGGSDEGLWVYDETTGSFWYWTGNQWAEFGLLGSGDNLGNHTATQTLSLNGNFLSGDGDSEGIFIDADGNVCLGDTTATEALEVNGMIRNVNDDPQIVFLEDGGTNGTRKSAIENSFVTFLGQNGPASQQMTFFVSNGTNNGVKRVMSLTGNGKTGIGTASPSAYLNVVGTVSGDTLVRLLNNAYAGALTVTSNSTDTTDIVNIQNGALVVLGNGNVGIGTTNPTNALSVVGNGGFVGGEIGIGTTNPKAPLHVNGGETTASFSGANNGGAWMYQASGAGTDEIGWAQDAGNTGVSIYTSGSIVSEGEGVFVGATFTWSDERIKHIEGISDANQDLQTIDDIDITDYTRIQGGKLEKKVIAQQLDNVYPQAVSLREGVIPSIYAHIGSFAYDEANQLLTIETPVAHGLAKDDRIDYYTETGKFRQQAVTTVLSENMFQVKAVAKPQELFVFGKWVPDVRVVDYDAVSMLNVSATQALHRIIKAQDQLISELQAEYDTLSAQNIVFEQRMAKIEELFTRDDVHQDRRLLTIANGAAITQSEPLK